MKKLFGFNVESDESTLDGEEFETAVLECDIAPVLSLTGISLAEKE